MRVTYIGFLVFGLTLSGNDAWGRPQKYKIVELIEQAPLVVVGRVTARTDDESNIVIDAVVKGDGVPVEIQIRDIARHVPLTPGLRLMPGELVMLFLRTPTQLFTSDHQSRLDVSGSDRLAELFRLYLEVSGSHENDTDEADRDLLKEINDYAHLSTLERRFVMQALGRPGVEVPSTTIDWLLERAMADTRPDVRWEAFDAARRLDLVMEKKTEFLRGLQDADRSVRAISFSALRTKVGKTFGYDPALSPARQAAAIAEWRSLITQN